MDVDYLGENAAEAAPHQVRNNLNIFSTCNNKGSTCRSQGSDLQHQLPSSFLCSRKDP